MKNLFKKLSAVILTIAMIAAMCVPVMADVPNAGKTGEITINNLGKGATGTAYQIVKGTYSDLGLVGYEALDFGSGKTVADVSKLTYDEVMALAAAPNNIKDGTSAAKTVPLTATDAGVAKANVEAGIWLVLFTDENANLYNPMVVSAVYDKAGEGAKLTGGSVDASGNADGKQITNAAYAKKTPVTVDKKITQVEGQPAIKNDKGDDVEIGKPVAFEITSTIPGYSDAYYQGDKYPKFKVYDELSAGFEAAENITVVVGNATLTKDTDYTLTETGNKFTIEFTKDYMTKAGVKGVPTDIKVTYTSKLTNAATVDFDANTNTAKVSYSNKPGTNDEFETDEKKTYHYTFAINASVSKNYRESKEETGSEKTSTDFDKLGEISNTTTEITGNKPDTAGWTDKDGAKIKEEEVRDNNGKVTKTIHKFVENGDGTWKYTQQKIEAAPQADAEFTLYYDPECKNPVPDLEAGKTDRKTDPYTRATNNKGTLTFKGLDATTYYMKETKAPSGYALNTKVIPVQIDASYFEDGQLKNYKITIDGKLTSDYTATHEKVAGTETQKEQDVVTYTDNLKDLGDPIYDFLNTKIPGLPSTGGIGTYLFTIVGVLLMAVAAGMFFVSRRRREAE